MLNKDDRLMNSVNNDRSKPQLNHKQGESDSGVSDNGKTNIPGPGEVPDQQKVGENDDEDKYHVET